LQAGGHLVRVDVLDVLDDPLYVAERIAHPAYPVAPGGVVELGDHAPGDRFRAIITPGTDISRGISDRSELGLTGGRG